MNIYIYICIKYTLCYLYCIYALADSGFGVRGAYFVRLYCINILTKHIFNYNILKMRSSFYIFCWKGRKVRKEKRWKENVNQKMLR